MSDMADADRTGEQAGETEVPDVMGGRNVQEPGTKVMGRTNVQAPGTHVMGEPTKREPAGDDR